MEISNSTFSAIIRKYDIEEKQNTDTKQDLKTEATVAPTIIGTNTNTDGFVKADGSISDISDVNFVSVYSADTESNGTNNTTEGEAPENSSTDYITKFSTSELNYIKKLIYNSHYSFIENFRDADTFFEYIHDKKDSTITKQTGISRSQLISFSQNDKWEDSHNDFFGSLNRSFYSLDKDGNGILSYSEIKNFLNSYLKKDGYSDFKTQVQSYSDEIQKEFESKNNQEKLEFALKLTEDYLKSAGLENQLAALNRLRTGTDLNSSAICKVGQISIVEYEDKSQLGGYTNNGYFYGYTNTNTNAEDVDKAYGEIPDDSKTTPQKPKKLSNGDGTFSQNIGYFADDDDEEGSDAGLTLSIKYLETGAKWEELVATLVHELTHATFSLFTTNGSEDGMITITESNLNALRNMGALTDEEYELAKENLKDLNDKYTQYVLQNDGKWCGGENMAITDKGYIENGTSFTEKENKILNNLIYKISAVRGEYMAYQADADFLDSVAGDIFNKREGDIGSDMAVAGKDEKDTIIKHLELCGYNTSADGTKQDNEVLPDWKWWSYA